MDNIQLVKNIKGLCQVNSISITNLLTECNLRKSLVYDIEKRNAKPSIEILECISDFFDVSIDFLIGRTDNPEINKAPVIIIEPTNIIKIPFEISKVSAGFGAYISDEYPTEIEIDANTYPKADFAVQITGDSMKPKYDDGEIVLVHKQPTLENGQIGIFMLNEKGYIKKYHYNENGSISLISLNPDYKDIHITSSDEFQIVGRVMYNL